MINIDRLNKPLRRTHLSVNFISAFEKKAEAIASLENFLSLFRSLPPFLHQNTSQKTSGNNRVLDGELATERATCLGSRNFLPAKGSIAAGKAKAQLSGGAIGSSWKLLVRGRAIKRRFSDKKTVDERQI